MFQYMLTVLLVVACASRAGSCAKASGPALDAAKSLCDVLRKRVRQPRAFRAGRRTGYGPTALVSSLPILRKALLMAFARVPIPATAAKPIRAATSAYSIRS